MQRAICLLRFLAGVLSCLNALISMVTVMNYNLLTSGVTVNKFSDQQFLMLANELAYCIQNKIEIKNA